LRNQWRIAEHLHTEHVPSAAQQGQGRVNTGGGSFSTPDNRQEKRKIRDTTKWFIG